MVDDDLFHKCLGASFRNTFTRQITTERAGTELQAKRHAKGPDPPWSVASCYRLFCRVVVKLTEFSYREIRVHGTDHRRQDFD
jgi:hypothetical protein